MSQTTETQSEAPAYLPADPTAFFAATQSIHGSSLFSAESTPALKRLGPLPFSGSTFPLMGFFASVYEHISTHAAGMLDKPPPTVE